MTHDQLVDRAFRWVLGAGKCDFAFHEFRTFAGEQPDVLGFKECGLTSVLIECKASISDVYADKKKIWRRYPACGMGHRRFMFCPPNLIKPGKQPEGWGLLYCYPKKVRKIVPSAVFKRFSRKKEIILMASALRRVHLRGDLEKIYTLETLHGN